MSRLLAGVIGLALVGYIGYLVLAQYRTQVAMQDAALKQLTADSSRLATSLGYFVSERKTDLKGLAQSRELSGYFENLALGMSMEYGLRASLIITDDLFKRTGASKLLDGSPIYERIAFIDTAGAVLADTLDSAPQVAAAVWQQYLKPEADGASLSTVQGGAGVRIVISSPVRFKGRYAGEVVAWIDPARLYRHFIEGRSALNHYPVALAFKNEYLEVPAPVRAVVGAARAIPRDLKPLTPYRLSVPTQQERRAGAYAIQVPVEGTPLSFIAFVPGLEMLDLNAPRHMLYTTGGIAIFILAGMFYLQLINTRNAVLQVHLEETTLRESAVDEKNRLLAAEIEERRQTERALRESEARFRGIVETVPVVIYEFRHGATGRSFTFVSDKIFEIAGISAEAMVADARTFFSLIHPEDREGTIAASDLAVATASRFCNEFRIVKPDGETRWVLATSLPRQGEPAQECVCHGFLEDITDRKQADLSLRESRRQLLDIIEFLPDATLVVDREGRVVAWNKAIEVMTGVPAQEMIGKGNYEYALPFYGERRPILIDIALDPEVAHGDYRSVSREAGLTYGESFTPGLGSEGIYLAGSASVLRNSSGEVTAAIECIRDSTERIRAESLLRESEATLRSLMDSMPAGVWWYDAAGEVEYLNSRFVELFGYGVEEIPTVDAWLGYAYPDPVQRGAIVAERDALIAEARQKGATVSPLETKVTCRDGRVRHIIVNTQFSKGRTLEIFTDITEQEFIDNELLKVQKLESLGVLAGGIAHDFNNILTGILGYISLAQMVLEGEQRARPMLEAAEKASRRASELAHQLLTFAKGGQPIKTVVPVPRLVEEALSLSLRGTSVQGRLEWGAPLFDIEADAGQMNQAFNNIVINAVHAMSGGGTLTVRGENVQLEGGSKLSLAPGAYVKLLFTDEGCGIEQGDLKKIFDPYFTTKSSGNGLGLASTLSIIRKHGGHIQVQSEVGVGTTFTIYLPAASGQGAAASATEKKPPQVQGRQGSGGAVLVMDDEEMIRTLSTKMLTQLGYAVRSCADGAEAVALYRAAKEEGNPFFAVIMDLTIPGGMGGKEAAQQILAYDASAKLVVSSGYSNDLALSDAALYGFRGAVAKPYKVSDLAETLEGLQHASGEAA